MLLSIRQILRCFRSLLLDAHVIRSIEVDRLLTRKSLKLFLNLFDDVNIGEVIIDLQRLRLISRQTERGSSKINKMKI